MLTSFNICYQLDVSIHWPIVPRYRQVWLLSELQQRLRYPPNTVTTLGALPPHQPLFCVSCPTAALSRSLFQSPSSRRYKNSFVSPARAYTSYSVQGGSVWTAWVCLLGVILCRYVSSVAVCCSVWCGVLWVFVSLVCVQEVAGLKEEDLPTVSPPTPGDSSSCRNTQQPEVLPFPFISLSLSLPLV